MKIIFNFVSKQSIIILLCLILSLNSFSQIHHFKSFGVEEGLAQSQIYSLIQDQKGFLWLGTDGGGVSKFDGKNFTNYSVKEGLPDNIVYSVLEDKKGNIWMGTNSGGAAKFNGSTFEIFNISSGLPHNKVYCIFQDSKDNIWFGTEKGLSKYDGKTFQNYFAGENGLIHDRIRAIVEDKKNNLWIGTDVGLVLFNGVDFKHYPNPGSLSSIVWSINPDNKGNLMIAWYNGGISIFDGKTFKNFNSKNGLNTDVNYSVFQDSEFNTWIGTDAFGINKITFSENHETITEIINFTEKEGLINNRVRKALEDAEHNLWFATDGGLVKYDNGRITGYNKSVGMLSNKIHAIHKSKNGDILFGTDNGLSILSKGLYKHYTVENGLPHNRIWSILEDSKGTLWIGTYEGLSKFNGKTFTNYNSNDGLPSNIIYDLHEDKAQNLWIGTDAGIVALQLNNLNSAPDFKIINQHPTIKNFRIRCIFQDSENALWFGTLGEGVIKYDGSNLKNIRFADGLANDIVFSISEDDQKNIWAGTYGGGLSRINTENGKIKITNLNSSNGLINDAILSIKKDHQGILWIGTLKGVDKFDASSFNLYEKISFKHFGKQEGFNGIECLQNSGFVDDKGKVWFGTINGAYSIDPSKDKRNQQLPLLYLKSPLLFLNPVDWKEYDNNISLSKDGLPENLVLPFDKNHLTFSYTGLSLSYPDAVRYKYKLENFDKDWSPVTKETYATYSNIPPGKYTFKVKAANNDDFWTSRPSIFSFEIKPPFWKTWWFYTSLTALFCMIILLIVWSIITKINAKKAEQELKLKEEISRQKITTGLIIETQEKERKRIAEELHDGLGQIFSAIKLNMNVVNEDTNLDGDKKHCLDTSMKLLDQGISELRAISHNMMPSNIKDLGLTAALQSLCKQIEQSHYIKLLFISHGLHSRLDQSIEITLYRITQELINNILKHSKASEVTVQLIRHEKSIMLQVEDNGIGFKFTDEDNGRKGIGLKNLKSRTEFLNGILTVDSGPETGTSVIVEIPLID